MGWRGFDYDVGEPEVGSGVGAEGGAKYPRIIIWNGGTKFPGMPNIL